MNRLARTVLLICGLAVCPSLASAQSFISLFTQLPSDFQNLAAPSNLLVLGTTGVGSLALHPKDDAIARRTHTADGWFAAGDVLGQGGVHAAAGLGIYVSGRLAHSTRWGTLGHDLVRAQIVSGIITDGLKLATNRTRPDGGDYSFPSGHTSTAFASAAVLEAHFGWKVGIPAYLMATYVSASRLAHHQHYASDILFGMGIGIASGRATTFHLRDSTVQVVPAIRPGSTAVNVSISR